MAMEVPAPPQGVIGSVCGWLYGVFGPGNIKQDHIRTLIGEMMTVSALLSGFAIGMSAKVTDGAIRSYATFLKKEFFGKESHFCSFDVVSDLPGATPIADKYGVPAGDTCNDERCWVGHWQTNDAAKELGFEACSLSAEEIIAAYPDYWQALVEQKVALVHIELGYNTMFIIMTTVSVVFIGSLLRLSIIKRSDAPVDWVRRFYPLVVLLACLPLINFFNFLNLASRVIRVIFYYCDDFITGQCLISATPAWGYLLRFLQGAAAAIWILHITIPTSPTPAEAKGDASSASNVALSDQLERLARLHEQRLLTADEFALAKKVALLDLGNELKAQGRPSPKKARVGEGTGRSRSPPPATDASASAGYD